MLRQVDPFPVPRGPNKLLLRVPAKNRLLFDQVPLHIVPQRLCEIIVRGPNISRRYPNAALHDIAGISAGDRILIHAATGGVGLAAVHLSKETGAEVFGTAGNARKRQDLSSMGIRHVMDSRSLSFADEILQATSGGGVNIVLNGLTGEFIQKSFSVLVQGGRFIEMGNREILQPAEVAAILDDVVYTAFDLMERAREEPAFVGELFNRLNNFLKNGGIRPLPMEVFPLRNVIDAYRFMSKARHIGKVVVVQERSSASCSHATPGRLAPDSTYLVVGELGSEGMDLCRRRGSLRTVATATSHRGISSAGRGGSG